MKRKAIEDTLLDLQEEARRKIITAPVHSFLIGILLGVALVWLGRFLIPLILISVLATVALWFLGEKDDPFAERPAAVPGKVNGQSQAQGSRPASGRTE